MARFMEFPSDDGIPWGDTEMQMLEIERFLVGHQCPLAPTRSDWIGASCFEDTAPPHANLVPPENLHLMTRSALLGVKTAAIHRRCVELVSHPFRASG